MAELLPCPFCGGEAELDTVDQGCWRIGCDGCGYDLMTGGVGIGWYSSLSAAKAAWNTRAAPASPEVRNG